MDDLVFRAMLGLPLIIYGHHTDFEDGLEPFRKVAARVAALGDVEWTPLAAITRGTSSAGSRTNGDRDAVCW